MNINFTLENIELENNIAMNNFFSDLTFQGYEESSWQDHKRCCDIASSYKNKIAESIIIVLSDNSHPQCFCEDAWQMILEEEKNGAMLMSETLHDCIYNLIEKYIEKLDIKIQTLLWLFAENFADEIYHVPDDIGQDIDDMNILYFSEKYKIHYPSTLQSIFNEIYLIAERENTINDEFIFSE